MTQNAIAASPAETIKAQEAALNQILDLLKSRNISKEEHERLWADGYERAVSLLDYKVGMGRLIAETPEGKKGRKRKNTPVGSELSKKEVYEALGLTTKQSDDYQLIAKKPEAVELAKEEAKKNKCLPTVYLVKKSIRPANERQEVQTVNDGTASAAGNNNPPTPQYLNIFTDNMKYAELPSDCAVEDFVSTTVDTLTEENGYSGKTYIYFEASQDKLLEYFKRIKEMADEVETGICLKP